MEMRNRRPQGQGLAGRGVAVAYQAKLGKKMLALEKLPRWLSGKESACQCRRHKRCGFDPWVGKIPWRRKWQPTLVFWPGKSHEQRSLAGYSPWGCKRARHDSATKHQQRVLTTHKNRTGRGF